MEGLLPAWGQGTRCGGGGGVSGCSGGDKGKSQQKDLVFASGIRKVFGHPFNWGQVLRGVKGPQCRGLQVGAEDGPAWLSPIV